MQTCMQTLGHSDVFSSGTNTTLQALTSGWIQTGGGQNIKAAEIVRVEKREKEKKALGTNSSDVSDIKR